MDPALTLEQILRIAGDLSTILSREFLATLTGEEARILLDNGGLPRTDNDQTQVIRAGQ